MLILSARKFKVRRCYPGSSNKYMMESLFTNMVMLNPIKMKCFRQINHNKWVIYVEN